MDQLKTALVAFKRHSFWVMCIGILLVSLGSWFYSTSQLAKDREAQAAKIKQSQTTLTTLKQSNPTHPNAGTNQGMDALIAEYSQEVAKGWEDQYNRQQSELVWPNDFGDDFLNAVNDLRPIEQLTYPTPIRDEIEVSYRRVYRNFIEDELPKMAKIIGTEWLASSAAASAAGSSGGGPGMAAPLREYNPTPGMTGPGMADYVDPSVVGWTQASQQELFNTHFGFCARVDAPTTLEILYGQEDIWVLTSLMEIIARTNEGAEARHDAAIKEIDFIRMGRNAIGLVGQVTPVGTPKTTAVPGSGDPTSTATEPGRGPGAPTTGYPTDGSGTGMGLVTADPADGRYVDDKYQPLPATRLREALKSTTPEDALIAVAKRMPVRMRFNMDQRKLNRLLTECGNSKLPLEVRQVRVNREPGVVSQTGGGAGYGGSSSYGGGSGYGGGAPTSEYGPGGPGGMGGQGARGTIGDSTHDSSVLPVEIYGVVYIYNPPNKTQLGIPEEPAATADLDAGSPPAVTPAAATPAETPAATPPAVNPAAAITPAANLGTAAVANPGG